MASGRKTLENQASETWRRGTYPDSVDDGLFESETNARADGAAEDLVFVLTWWRPKKAVLTKIASSHRVPRVREVAGRRLAQLLTRNVRDCGTLGRLARNDQFKPVRLAAIEKLRDPTALFEPLCDIDPEIGQRARESISKAGVSVASMLRTALESSESQVRCRAAASLGEIGDTGAVEHLCLALKDPECTVRRSATEALNKVGDGRAVEPLIGALSDTDEVVRVKAGGALVRVAASCAFVGPSTASSDNDHRVSNEACDALASLLDGAAPQARMFAAMALGAISGPRAVRHLSVALSDEDSSVRLEAVKALRWIGGEEAAQVLHKALNDEDSTIRSIAESSLKRLADHDRGRN